MRHIKHYALAAVCLALAGCAGRESTQRKFEANEVDKQVMRREISELNMRLNAVEGRVDDVAGTVGVLATGIYEVKTARGNRKTSYVAYAPPLPREAAPPAPAQGPAPVAAKVETTSAPLALPPAGGAAPAAVPAPAPAAAPAAQTPASVSGSAAPAPVVPQAPAAAPPPPPALTLPSDNAPGAVPQGGRVVQPVPAAPPKGKSAQPARQQPARQAPAPAAPEAAPGLSLPPESGAPAPRKITSGAKDVSERASEESDYKAALNMVTSGKAVAGESQFREFLRQYPSGRYAPNAEYWIGEALYSQSKYAEALAQFKLVAAKYPKHHKTADALLKAGMTSERLGDKAGAAQEYRTLLAEFPQSESAGRIRHKVNRSAVAVASGQ